MRRITEERLLRSYIRQILKEDDGGGDAAGYGMDFDTPYGVGFGGPSLFKTFISPFVDVAKTAAASGENIAASSRALLKVALEAVITTAIPFFSSDYAKIFEKERKDLTAVKEKYRDVFERTDKVLAGNDFKCLAFMVDPRSFLTMAVAQKTPQVALDILEALAGENQNIRNFIQKFAIKTTATGSGAKDVSVWQGESKTLKGRYLAEATPQAPASPAVAPNLQTTPPDPNAKLAKALTDPRLAAELAKAPKVQQMKADAEKVISSSLKELMAHAQNAMSIRDVNQLKTAVPHINLSGLDKLQPQDKKAAEATLMQQFRSATKNMYVKMLQSQVATAQKSGATANNPMLVAYSNVLKKISSM
jgi:hypothetical protein